jgi:hypothetical protein
MKQGNHDFPHGWFSTFGSAKFEDMKPLEKIGKGYQFCFAGIGQDGPCSLG